MSLVAGLSAATGPAQTNKGHLALPIGFDTKQFVGRWEKRGPRAMKAGQPEPLGAVDGRLMQAEGWAVWKDSHNKPCIRVLNKGDYILLFRPISLQHAIQKIYGNASRERMEQEQNGSTVAGQAVEDSGILTEDVLSRIPGLGREDAEKLHIPRNSLVDGENPRATTATAKSKQIKFKT